MNDLKVSVLIPVYNMELYIEEAVQSVLNQTYSDYEIIIVDNHSKDKTLDILLKYENYSNIKIIKNESNFGMAQNWNRCLYYASGKYIKFLNADDILEKTALKEFVDILENNPDISLATSHYRTFGIDNNMMYTKYVGKIDGKTAIINTIETNNWIGCPTQVIFRRNDLYVGYFNIASTWWSDMDLWYRLLTIGDLFVIDKVLSQNRSHATQVSHQFANQRALVSHYSFFKVMLESDVYSFCKEVLERKIKKMAFILYYEGVLNTLKGKYEHGQYLLKESGSPLLSRKFLKIPFFYFDKKMKNG